MSSTRWLTVLAAIATLLLTWHVIEVKRDRATLANAVRDGLMDFVHGLPLPPLPVQLVSGATSLDRLCAEDAMKAIFFVQSTCAGCAQVYPYWRRAVDDMGIDAAVVHVGILPEVGEHVFDHDAVARSQDYLTHFRVNRVPAIVGLDDSCNMSRAGAGVESSLAAIRELEGSW